MPRDAEREGQKGVGERGWGGEKGGIRESKREGTSRNKRKKGKSTEKGREEESESLKRGGV